MDDRVIVQNAGGEGGCGLVVAMRVLIPSNEEVLRTCPAEELGHEPDRLIERRPFGWSFRVWQVEVVDASLVHAEYLSGSADFGFAKIDQLLWRIFD